MPAAPPHNPFDRLPSSGYTYKYSIAPFGLTAE